MLHISKAFDKWVSPLKDILKNNFKYKFRDKFKDNFQDKFKDNFMDNFKYNVKDNTKNNVKLNIKDSIKENFKGTIFWSKCLGRKHLWSKIFFYRQKNLAIKTTKIKQTNKKPEND